MKDYYISKIWNTEFPDWYVIEHGLIDDWFVLVIARADKDPVQLSYKDNVVKIKHQRSILP